MTILAIIMAALFSSSILFLAYIYPNLKKPDWERKIVSANYLRVRKRGSLADDVLIQGIKRTPTAWQLYRNLFISYATPWDMKKLYDVMALGVKTIDKPCVFAYAAWCLIQEGEFEKAEEMLKREEVEEYLYEQSLCYLPLLYFKQEKYQECENSFVSFYKKVYSDVTGGSSLPDGKTSASNSRPAGSSGSGTGAGKNEIEENKIFADLPLDELVILVIARKKLDKNWRAVASILPLKSLHEEKNWTSYYEKLLKQKANLKVETGIYGPPEKLLALREKELNERLEITKEYLKIK